MEVGEICIATAPYTPGPRLVAAETPQNGLVIGFMVNYISQINCKYSKVVLYT